MFMAVAFAGQSMGQIGFNEVYLEGWVGTGQNEAMLIIDFDSDPVGMDSTFAWGVNFESDSINGEEILFLIAQSNEDFTFTVAGSFLDNIVYQKNSQTYTNPNSGWFSILESFDGENWEWNMGIQDNIGNDQWYGMVAMNPITYEAEINVPILTNVLDFMNVTSVKVYPNPATDLLNIVLSESQKIIITNIAGQVVFEIISEGETIDVSSLEPGMYLITIVAENSTTTQKVIVK